MADFLTAYKRTNQNEGGYTRDPHETYAGIDRRFWPNWEGWSIVDSYKNSARFPESMKYDQRLAAAHRAFYKTNFWDRIRGDEIKSQDIANDFYDMAVNLGTAGSVGVEEKTQGIPEDHIMGDNLLNHLNNNV